MEKLLSKEIVSFLINKEIDIAKKIRKDNRVSKSSNEAYAFIISVLRKTISESITESKLKEIIFDGKDECGFDVINITPRRIEIYDFKDTNSSFSEHEVYPFLEKILNFIFKEETLPSKMSFLVKNRIKQIIKIIDSKKIKVRIYFVRNGFNNPEDWLIAGANKKIKKENIEIKYINQKDIISDVYENNQVQDLEFNFNVDKNNLEDYFLYKHSKILITRVNIKYLLKGLVKESNLKNYNLYHDNVRGFLGKKEPSKGMLVTIKDYKKDFHLFHNGITLACQKIKNVRVLGGSFAVTNPQVLNGCQTLETLYEKYLDNLDDKLLEEASILCRFFVLDSKKALKVCQSSNTQNKIDSWELRSNDKEQKLIEYYLNNTLKQNFEYKRKSGKSKSGNVSLPELGQWLYAAIFEKPAEAKNKKTEIFQIDIDKSIYEQIYQTSKVKPVDLIRICEIGVFLKKAKKEKEVIKRTEIKGLDKETELSLIRSADFHILSSFYYTKNKLNDENLQALVNKIYKVVKKIQKEKEGDYDIKRIFTQDLTTWSKIKKIL
ncbi:MAG: AIPR family protein [Patescibacteria group bacterium]|jgi:hypothetical protein